MNEGIRLNPETNDFEFDFNQDNKTDIIKLKFNKDFITSKTSYGVLSYFSFKINKKVDKDIRFKLLNDIKTKSIKQNSYEQLLNKAVIGLLNNSNLNIKDVDLILIPQSSSSLNFDLANKLKNKIPNALFLTDVILKNEPENVTLNYSVLKEKKYTEDSIVKIENMLLKATVDGVFKIKKVAPRFRRFIVNFLKIDLKNRHLLNKLIDGKVLIVDDIVSEGTTFKDVKRLLENYAPKEVILFSLIG